jgi:predicted CoA-binding protein
MTSRAAVDDFVAQRTLAVVGVSRSGKKFGNTIYRELKTRGYHRETRRYMR